MIIKKNHLSFFFTNFNLDMVIRSNTFESGAPRGPPILSHNVPRENYFNNRRTDSVNNLTGKWSERLDEAFH